MHHIINWKKYIFLNKNTKIPTNGDIIAPILENVEHIPIPTFLQKKYELINCVIFFIYLFSKCQTSRIKLNNVYLQYLRLVGYNSGVNRKSVLKEPVTDIFPANVAITESIISVSSPSVKETNTLKQRINTIFWLLLYNKSLDFLRQKIRSNQGKVLRDPVTDLFRANFYKGHNNRFIYKRKYNLWTKYFNSNCIINL